MDTFLTPDNQKDSNDLTIGDLEKFIETMPAKTGIPEHTTNRAAEILAELGSDGESRAWRITLPFPPSSNTAYPSGRSGKRHLSKQGRAWYNEALPIIEEALRTMDAPWRIEMTFLLCFPNNRKADLNNYIKLPQDAVCSVLGIDDNHFNVPDIRIRSLGVDKDNAHCTVLIKPMIYA